MGFPICQFWKHARSDVTSLRACFQNVIVALLKAALSSSSSSHPSPNTTPHLQPLTGLHLASPVVKCLFSNICIFHAVNALLLPESPAIFFLFFFLLSCLSGSAVIRWKVLGSLRLPCLYKEARLNAVAVKLHPAHVQASFWNEIANLFWFHEGIVTQSLQLSLYC